VNRKITVQAYLILKLKGPLQSWGTHTYEDYRPSNLFPTQSGILGLLAACLGIERSNSKQLQTLDQSVELAVRADPMTTPNGERVPPTKITDFHTVMDARKGGGKVNKYPIVSRREYLCDAEFTVAVRESATPKISLDQIEAAVQKPYYTPFLGRRACPLSRPLRETRLNAESFEQALTQIEPKRGVVYSEWLTLEHSRLQMRDVPLRTAKRQFGTRYVIVGNMDAGKEKSNVPE
jgi:CRISPR system Cascade subunit CasD